MDPDTRPEVVTRARVPPWQRHRPLKTVALYCAFVTAGVSYAILGPSVVSMEILLDTDTKSVSAGFTGNSVGFLLGAVLCGFVYGRLNKQLLFMLSMVTAGAMTVMIAFSWNLGMFVGTMAVQGFCFAFIDTGSQPYILKLWEGQRYMAAVMQALHSMWSIGSTLGPFILHPFLADVHRNETEMDTSNNETWANDTDFQDELREDVASVRSGFLITAGAIFATAVVFLATFLVGQPSFLEQHRKRLRTNASRKDETTVAQSQKWFRIKLLMLAAMFYFFFSWVENLPANYLATFVVKELGWENDRGALITSTYWGMHGSGRLLGIALAMCLNPREMVIADLTVTFIGFFLLFFSHYHHSIAWIAASVSGLGIATLFPSSLLYLERYVEVTGSASSIVVASTSVGGMIAPLLTGFLVTRHGPMTVCYVCMGSVVLESVVCVGIVVYSRRYGVLRHKEVKERRGSSESLEMKSLRSGDGDR